MYSQVLLGVGMLGVVLCIGTYLGIKTRPELKRYVETQVRVAGFVVIVLLLLPFLEEVGGFWPTLRARLQEVPRNVQTTIGSCANPS